jgi:hypothetical protein
MNYADIKNQFTVYLFGSVWHKGGVLKKPKSHIENKYHHTRVYKEWHPPLLMVLEGWVNSETKT